MSGVVEMPPCPREHGSKSIVFGGRYGPGKTRQLYKCVPADGSKAHRFVPVLPREPLPGEARCVECENPIHRHEGPKRARSFRWPVRTVAQTLLRVAAGETYTRASASVRDSSGREAGMLAADWVEAYTEDLWRELGPKRWPQFLVADTKTYQARDWSLRKNKTKPPSQGEKLRKLPVFTLLVIAGADAPATPMDKMDFRPVMAVALPFGGVSALDWMYVFSLLPGRPLGVTSDDSSAFFQAVEMWWPDDPVTGEALPAASACLFHLKERFRVETAPRWTLRPPYGPTSKARSERLWLAWKSLGDSPQDWDEFVAAAKDLHDSKVFRWLSRNLLGVPKEHAIRNQLARPWPKGPDSNSAVEGEIRRIDKAWGPGRATSFRNAERTNRLLKLMVLHGRGASDEREWTRIIDEAFTERGGRPADLLRTVSDRAGTKPSLRC